MQGDLIWSRRFGQRALIETNKDTFQRMYSGPLRDRQARLRSTAAEHKDMPCTGLNRRQASTCATGDETGYTGRSSAGWCRLDSLRAGCGRTRPAGPATLQGVVFL